MAAPVRSEESQECWPGNRNHVSDHVGIAETYFGLSQTALQRRRYDNSHACVAQVIAGNWDKKCEPVHKRGKYFSFVQEVPGGYRKNPNAIADASI